MMLKKDDRGTRRTRASSDGSFAMVNEVTEELLVTFGERLPRTLIRSCVLEAMLDVTGALKACDLRSVVALIATFRLSALDERLQDVAAPADAKPPPFHEVTA